MENAHQPGWCSFLLTATIQKPPDNNSDCANLNCDRPTDQPTHHRDSADQWQETEYIYPPVCLIVARLPICLLAHLSVCLPVCLAGCHASLFVCFFVCLPVYLFVWTSVSVAANSISSPLLQLPPCLQTRGSGHDTGASYLTGPENPKTSKNLHKRPTSKNPSAHQCLPPLFSLAADQPPNPPNPSPPRPLPIQEGPAWWCFLMPPLKLIGLQHRNSGVFPGRPPRQASALHAGTPPTASGVPVGSWTQPNLAASPVPHGSQGVWVLPRRAARCNCPRASAVVGWLVSMSL